MICLVELAHEVPALRGGEEGRDGAGDTSIDRYEFELQVWIGYVRATGRKQLPKMTESCQPALQLKASKPAGQLDAEISPVLQNLIFG